MPFRSGAIVLACLLAVAGGSRAGAAGNQEREWRAACTHDALVHCTFSALRADRTGIRSCLLKRLDKISARCRADVEGVSADNDRNTGAASGADAGGLPENAVSPR
jgi:hypothetical protein